MQVRVSAEQVAGAVTVSARKAMTETPLAIVEPHGAVQEACDTGTGVMGMMGSGETDTMKLLLTVSPVAALLACMEYP